MTGKAGPDYFELSDYTGVLRRRWLTIAGLALIGLLVAGAYYEVSPKTYTSSVLVEVSPLPPSANLLGGHIGGGISMDNEAQLAKSAAVVSIVASKIHSTLPLGALIKDVAVSAPPNTTFLQMSCSQPTPLLAQQCASALGNAYLYNRRVSAYDLLTGEMNAYQAKADSLLADIQKLSVERSGLPKHSTRRAQIALQITEKTAQANTLAKDVKLVQPLATSLGSTTTAIVGTIATPANLPARASSPRKLIYLPSGLVVGLIVGLFLAYYRNRRDRRIHSAGDLERLAALPAVFVLDDARQIQGGPVATPWSKAGQSFAELGQYAAAVLGDGPHVLLVVGTAASGGSLVATNLAAALARSRGETVLLTKGPRGGPGLAEMLAGSATLTDVARRATDLPRLSVVSTGLDSSGNPYDLQYDRLSALFAELRENARFVVIDVQSADTDAIAFSLAEFADGAILVAQINESTTDSISECAVRLDRLRTPVLAAALLPAGRLASGRVEPQTPAQRPHYGRAGGPAAQPATTPALGATQAATSKQPAEPWQQSPGARARRGADSARPATGS